MHSVITDSNSVKVSVCQNSITKTAASSSKYNRFIVTWFYITISKSVI